MRKKPILTAEIIKFLGNVPIIRMIFYRKTGRIRSKYSKYITSKEKKHVGAPDFFVRPRVLILAETTIPQCFSYRVKQKKDIFAIIGIETTIVSWTKISSLMSFVNTHTHMILYRVPHAPHIEEAVKAARSLGVKVYYDIDDLVFDVDSYKIYLDEQKNITKKEKDGLLKGAESYHQMMSHADLLIGSTSALTRRMGELFGKQVIQIDNAIKEEEQVEVSSVVNLGPEGHVRIIYGSGTRTHDEDLKLIEGPLIATLEKIPDASLVLVGPLNISDRLRKIENRIIKLPMMRYNKYIEIMKKCDIALAPLVPNFFNDCKSAIKLLEAAACGIPTIASATQAFKDAKALGVPVVLAETEQEWEQSLQMLLGDRALRHQLGKSAKKALKDTFSYEIISRRQYNKLISYEEINRSFSGNEKPNIMLVNLFWNPLSFGGATLVAENLVDELRKTGMFNISVCTGGIPDEHGAGVRRDQVDGVCVFRILSNLHGSNEWSNRDTAAYFNDVLKYSKPDLVHFHCVQGMGFELMSVCCKLNIPYVVTVHDAWWLCARQFLIRENGKYCKQEVIDETVCSGCVDTPELLEQRNSNLKNALAGATYVIAPSKYWRKFYQDNGIAEEKLIHVENGVRMPREAPSRISTKMRFGFIGGKHVVKGFENIRKAFSEIETSMWELYLFDSSTKFGRKKFSAPRMGKGDVIVLSGYAQDKIDEAFAKFDVLLFPSLWPESFGLAVREALARGKWVITSDSGGQCEPIVDGINGRLIPLDDDGTALRFAIEEAIIKLDVSQPVFDKAKITTVEENAKLTAELYERILIRERCQNT